MTLRGIAREYAALLRGESADPEAIEQQLDELLERARTGELPERQLDMFASPPPAATGLHNEEED